MPQIDKVSFIFIASDLIIIFFITYTLISLFIFLPFFNIIKLLPNFISFVFLNFSLVKNFYLFKILKI